LAPLPWPSASISLLTSTPSFLPKVSDSWFATMHDHSSMLLMVLVIVVGHHHENDFSWA
jgi:hypothetical protein